MVFPALKSAILKKLCILFQHTTTSNLMVKPTYILMEQQWKKMTPIYASIFMWNIDKIFANTNLFYIYFI